MPVPGKYVAITLCSYLMVFAAAAYDGQLKQTMFELSGVLKAIDGAVDPIELVDQLDGWEALIAASRVTRSSISDAITKTDAAIAALQKTATQYDDQTKLDAIDDRIAGLKSQADSLFIQQKDLGKLIDEVEKKINELKSNPDLVEVLELKRINKQVDDAIKNADAVLPESLK